MTNATPNDRSQTEQPALSLIDFKTGKLRYLLGSVGLTLVIAATVLSFGRYDALLLVTIIPSVWAAFRYDRRTYSFLTFFNAAASVYVVYHLFDDPLTSLHTIAVCTLTIFVLSEAIYRVVRRGRELEVKLKQTEERLSQIAENIEETVWLADRQSFLYLSPAHATIWGSPRDEQTTLTREEFLQTIVEEDRHAVSDYFAAQFDRPQQVEYHIRRPDGSVRLIRDRSFPVPSESAEVRVAGVAEDITDQRALEEELRHAQKIEVLGRMAGCVAHDFNNVLSVIQSYAYLLRSELNGCAQKDEAVAEIEHAVDRATSLTRRLLAFTRKQKPVRKVADLNDIVKHMAVMFIKLLDSGTRLHFQPSASPLAIRVDSAILEHAILNLLINARDSMPHGGNIILGTASVALPSNGSSSERLFACLTVADTGSGMAPEVLRRIFEPFFTTKPVGKGTGLGLSAVDRAIKENDGEIEIVSNVGQGTAFKLMFPIVSQTPISRDEAPAATDLESGDDRIIVLVEEDPHIRAATKRILTSAGYNALECRSALRAIELCGGLKDQIGLIIADVSLPDGFSGMELAAELRKTQPALRVLFTTGNPLQLPAENEITETVTKPCKPEKLLGAVKKLLAGESYPAQEAGQFASVSREPVSLSGN